MFSPRDPKHRWRGARRGGSRGWGGVGSGFGGSGGFRPHPLTVVARAGGGVARVAGGPRALAVAVVLSAVAALNCLDVARARANALGVRQEVRQIGHLGHRLPCCASEHERLSGDHHARRAHRKLALTHAHMRKCTPRAHARTQARQANTHTRAHACVTHRRRRSSRGTSSSTEPSRRWPRCLNGSRRTGR